MRTRLIKLNYKASLVEMLQKLKEKKAREIIRLLPARNPNENTFIWFR